MPASDNQPEDTPLQNQQPPSHPLQPIHPHLQTVNGIPELVRNILVIENFNLKFIINFNMII